MGLFDRKICGVCGEKIGLFGNRKLEDSDLCRNCASKLSPFFTGRRHARLEDVRRQLEAREKNRAEVAAFCPSRTFGKSGTLLFVDEAAGKFAVCTETDLKKGNPDIIPLSLITSRRAYWDEHKTEKKYRDAEGKQVSFVPPQYEYSYDFFCEIGVNHPYIDTINFRLNSLTVSLKEGLMYETSMKEYNGFCALCREIEEYLGSIRPSESGSAVREVSFTSEPFVAAGEDETVGRYAIEVTVTLRGMYRICDETAYSLMCSATGKDVSFELENASREAVSELTLGGKSPEQITSNPELITEELKKRLDAGKKIYGVEFTGIAAVAVPTEKSREMLLNIAKMRALGFHRN